MGSATGGSETGYFRTAYLWSVPALGLVWSKYIVAFVHKHSYKVLYYTCDIRGQALMHVKSRLVSVSPPYRSLKGKADVEYLSQNTK